MKRQRDPDLHVEETPPGSSYTSYIPNVLMSAWHGLASQSQEIVALDTTPPSEHGTAAKRRAIAREDIPKMPGRFPTPSEPPEARPRRLLPTTPSPSPPRPGDRAAQPRAPPSTTQRVFSWLYSWVEYDTNTATPANDTASQPRTERFNAPTSVAPPVPAKDYPVEPRQSQTKKSNYLSITERLALQREQETSGKRVTTDLRQSYGAATPNREPAQPVLTTPRTDINRRQSFRKSHNGGLSRSTNAVRDTEIDGLLDRVRRITHESAEETRFRESHKTRLRRFESEKGRTGRARERQERERKSLEEERLLEEQKAEEPLQAQREEERKAREEQEALEAAKAAEEARKDLLIQPLEPKWTAIVNNAMSSTDGHQVFSEAPDGNGITRVILGRFLPQKNEAALRASVGVKTGPGSWLNDECVDHWVTMIVARRLEQEGYVKGPNNIPSIASYLSAFWKTYNDRGAKGLNGWSRRKGISGKKVLKVEKILFPINTGNHWILLVISPKSHTIEVFDSAGGSSSRFFKFARDWLEMELGADYNADEWQHSSVQSSVQQNWDDCGVFTCANALASAKNKPPSAVVASDGMNDARSMMVAVLINGGFKDDWDL